MMRTPSEQIIDQVVDKLAGITPASDLQSLDHWVEAALLHNARAGWRVMVRLGVSADGQPIAEEVVGLILSAEEMDAAISQAILRHIISRNRRDSQAPAAAPATTAVRHILGYLLRWRGPRQYTVDIYQSVEEARAAFRAVAELEDWRTNGLRVEPPPQPGIAFRRDCAGMSVWIETLLDGTGRDA